jgi:3-carboxy-cis,cis-muconate cycloisomerase
MPRSATDLLRLHHRDHLLVRQHVAALLDAMVEDHERATGPWKSSGSRCRRSSASPPARRRRGHGRGLVVDEEKMRANLDITHAG